MAPRFRDAFGLAGEGLRNRALPQIWEQYKQGLQDAEGNVTYNLHDFTETLGEEPLDHELSQIREQYNQDRDADENVTHNLHDFSDTLEKEPRDCELPQIRDQYNQDRDADENVTHNLHDFSETLGEEPRDRELPQIREQYNQDRDADENVTHNLHDFSETLGEESRDRELPQIREQYNQDQDADENVTPSPRGRHSRTDSFISSDVEGNSTPELGLGIPRDHIVIQLHQPEQVDAQLEIHSPQPTTSSQINGLRHRIGEYQIIAPLFNIRLCILLNVSTGLSILGSSLLGLIWSILRDDVQGGFTMAGYLVAVASLASYMLHEAHKKNCRCFKPLLGSNDPGSTQTMGD